ncbi:MAG: hypothetical protein JW923_04605 [Spirochaetales bacterium]|nr:hypothetical protein [Spirochaetales bacterium]
MRIYASLLLIFFLSGCSRNHVGTHDGKTESPVVAATIREAAGVNNQDAPALESVPEKFDEGRYVGEYFADEEILERAKKGFAASEDVLLAVSGVWEAFSEDQLVLDERHYASLHEERIGGVLVYSSPTSLIIDCISGEKILSVQGMFSKRILGCEEREKNVLDLYLEGERYQEKLYGVLRITMVSDKQFFLTQVFSPFYNDGEWFYGNAFLSFGKDAIWHQMNYEKK